MAGKVKRTEARLTKRQIGEYKQWIAELAEEAGQPGGDPDVCDREVWAYFDPRGAVGVQIYQSFSDEELIATLFPTMDHPGHKPRFEEVYIVYRRYLKLRFGGLEAAKRKARTRYKQIRDEQKWPPDWPERVSPDALLAHCRERGVEVSMDDQLELERFCSTIQRERKPLCHEELSGSQCAWLAALGGSWKKALDLMGIPVLNKRQVYHLERYWARKGSRHREA